MTQKIDYFFAVGSPWAYIGLAPFIALAKANGIEVVPHAIPLIEENGGIYSRNRPEARRAYWIKDLKRWAKLRNAPLQFAGREALSDPTPAGDLILAAWLQGLDWVPLAEALHGAFWGRAEDIGAPDVRKAIADGAGYDGVALETFAASDAVTQYRKSSLETARAAGVFGLPSYLVDGELFWGQDNLPFLERHLKGETLIA